ncbi:MAG: hypothetical protein FWE84_02925 [Firmicutes bacterium]|nr:hypothetical protein [Bacillota bacterium]
MKLDKLLEYQDIDIKLRRQLDVVERSEDAKKIEQAKNEFAACRKTVEESEKASAALLEFFASGKKYFEEAQKRMESIESAASSEDSEEDINAIIADLDKLKKRLGEMEGKISDKKNRAEGVVKTYAAASERGRKIRDFHARAKERQDVLRGKIEPEINRLKARLKELEPEIEPEIMKQYKSLTHERIYPAFVEVYRDDKTFSCRGCGLALSQTNSSALSGKGYCVCESCRRIIYKKQ